MSRKTEEVKKRCVHDDDVGLTRAVGDHPSESGKRSVEQNRGRGWLLLHGTARPLSRHGTAAVQQYSGHCVRFRPSE
ncbi:hypothetical protein J6590_014187 [Homalodisca vitripennis]|nr:hypothetical protein J6590_014187 [Homalodisca vitripennis]